MSRSTIKSGLTLLFAASEAIREAGEIPSGTLYAVLAGRVDFIGYEKMVRVLKGAGLVAEDRGHLLRWIGPHLEASNAR